MRPEMRVGLSAIEKREVWSRWKQGESLHAIGRAFDKPHGCIRCCASDPPSEPSSNLIDAAPNISFFG